MIKQFGILVTVISVAFAGLSTSIANLINEPVSMLDLGCYRLSKAIDQIQSINNSILWMKTVKFDYQSSTIIIEVSSTLVDSTSAAKNSFVELSKKVINAIKVDATVFYNSKDDEYASVWGGYFMHYGYTNANETNGVKNIEKHIKICVIGSNYEFQKKVVVSSLLLSKDFEVVETSTVEMNEKK